MKKLLTMIALGGMLTGCSNDSGQDKPADPRIMTLDGNKTSHAPCVIEVPCDMPELTAIQTSYQRKFYNFCDSTVTILYWKGVSEGMNSGRGGPGGWSRPITDLHGTEKAEMDIAYKKYQSGLGVK